MSFRTPEELFSHAYENRYCVGAFNVFSLESMMAVMEAAENTCSPAVIQVSSGAEKYVKNVKAFVRTIRDFGKDYKAPFFIQHDHIKGVEACFKAIDDGFDAVMFDGSRLPYEENIASTIEVVKRAHEKGVWVEAELGAIAGFEDFVYGENTVYTDPDQAMEFIEKTGCDALAISVGTAHGGVRADDYLPLERDLLLKITGMKKGYPFVLHGAASLPPELITKCNETGMDVEYLRICSEENILFAARNGILKANMDVDNFLCFTTAARRTMIDKPAVYDPRKYLEPARDAFRAEVEHKMRNVLDSAGRYL
jgi:fructose-bisphosphate aldolase class II